MKLDQAHGRTFVPGAGEIMMASTKCRDDARDGVCLEYMFAVPTENPKATHSGSFGDSEIEQSCC